MIPSSQNTDVDHRLSITLQRNFGPSRNGWVSLRARSSPMQPDRMRHDLDSAYFRTRAICSKTMKRFVASQCYALQLSKLVKCICTHGLSHVQAIAPVRYVNKCKPQGQRTQILLTRREIHSVRCSQLERLVAMCRSTGA